jgi:thymidylate kinase
LIEQHSIGQYSIERGEIRLNEAPAGYAGEATVRAILDELERHCSAYCLLGACDDLPGAVHSDIDFMVAREDFERLPRALKAAADTTGFRLVQELKHETTARYFVLAQSRPGKILYLHPDAAADYRRSGRTWLRAEAVLKRRRRHANGFWAAAAGDNFDYYLIKCIDKGRLLKGRLEERQARLLSRLFAEDAQGCEEALTLRFSQASAERIATACRTGEWEPVVQRAQALDEELLARAPADSLSARFAEIGRRLRRWAKPTGLWVAVLGPDGSGKSTVIEKMQAALAMGFRRTARFHLRPQWLRGTSAGEAANLDSPNTDPHGQAPRGVLASVAKLIFFWADFGIGSWVQVRPLLVRSTLVIFDRYYPDLLIDPRRFRYKGPRWLARLVGALIPMPDLMLILDAPAEVLQARKREVSAEETARQVEAYREFAGSKAARGRAVLVNAAAPVDEVIHACAEVVLARMAARTAQRLGIE